MKKKTMLLSAAILAASTGVAMADDHGGFYGAAGATLVDGDYTFTGGKPAQELSGAMPLVRVGYDHQWGGDDGWLVTGISAFSTFGDGIQSGPVRDGNLLVQDGTIDQLTGYEVRVGVAAGPWLIYGAYGETSRDGTTRQSCPNDPNASINVGGYCAGGFVLATATARAGQREGSVGGSASTWSLGIERNLGEHAFIDLRYSETDFGTEIVALAPTGNTPGQVAHPSTNPSQNLSGATLAVGWRF